MAAADEEASLSLVRGVASAAAALVSLVSKRLENSSASAWTLRKSSASGVSGSTAALASSGFVQVSSPTQFYSVRLFTSKDQCKKLLSWDQHT